MTREGEPMGMCWVCGLARRPSCDAHQAPRFSAVPAVRSIRALWASGLVSVAGAAVLAAGLGESLGCFAGSTPGACASAADHPVAAMIGCMALIAGLAAAAVELSLTTIDADADAPGRAIGA